MGCKIYSFYDEVRRIYSTSEAGSPIEALAQERISYLREKNSEIQRELGRGERSKPRKPRKKAQKPGGES